MLRLRDKPNSSPVNSNLPAKHLLGCYKRITVLPQTNDNKTNLDSHFLVVITAKAETHSSECFTAKLIQSTSSPIEKSS